MQRALWGSDKLLLSKEVPAKNALHKRCICGLESECLYENFEQNLLPNKE